MTLIRKGNGGSSNIFKNVFKGVFFIVLVFEQLWITCGNLANFNLFMDRHEAQKLLGLPSDIFYVREGVVNEYALNFTVKVPAAVEHLRFSWQSFTKRPVQYEMVIEYTNFFALLPPVSNVTNMGRVPPKLESFRVSLPCSGRINAEVAVNIRFKFYSKHYKGPTSSNQNPHQNQTLTKGNITTINLMRNKICLLQEFSSFEEAVKAAEAGLGVGTKPPTPSSVHPTSSIVPKSKSSGKGWKDGSEATGASNVNVNGKLAGIPVVPVSPVVVSNNSTLLLFQDPTPSLLLAGLLGGCAVTASIVFLIFFICLRRKLVPSSGLVGTGTGESIINSDPNSSSNNSSPACLLRQPSVGGGSGDPKWTTGRESCCDSNTFKDKYSYNPTSTVGSRNSYVTIASFWNDIFGTHGNPHQHHQQHSHHSSANNGTNGSASPPSAKHHQQRFSTKISSGRSQCSHGCHGNSNSNSNSPAHQQHQHFYSSNPVIPNNPPQYHSNNYHLNSSFNSQHLQNPNSTNISKGSDVSPYAYAHIVPKIAPPPPPLIEWYSESTCNNGGHVFTNNLFSFQQQQPQKQNQPPQYQHIQHSKYQHQQQSPQLPAIQHQNILQIPPPTPPPLPPPKNQGILGATSASAAANTASATSTVNASERGDGCSSVTTDGHASSTTRSAGSGSLIQIDGFQCRKNLIKDSHIVERFL